MKNTWERVDYISSVDVLLHLGTVHIKFHLLLISGSFFMAKSKTSVELLTTGKCRQPRLKGDDSDCWFAATLKTADKR